MPRPAALDSLPAEERLLCALARIDAADPAAFPDTLLDGPVDWDGLWVLAVRHEIVPLVWSSLRAVPGRRARVPGSFAVPAERRYLATMLRNTTRIEELGRVLRAFGDASIDLIPVKGPAIAVTVYDNVALRVFDDLDVLVRHRQIDPARRVLQDLGYRTRHEPLFEELHHPFHDLQHFREMGGADVVLELHWDLWASHSFGSDVDGLWTRSRRADLAGEPARLLADEDVLLHLAIHRTRAPLRLRMVCDVAELVRRNGTRLDWDGLTARAEALGARTACHMMLRLATDLLGAPVPVEVLRRTDPGRAKRAVLEWTCGRRALFRRVADDDVKQQPKLIYRVLEQDGFPRIVRSGLRAMLRKPARWRYQRRPRVDRGARRTP